MPWLSRKLFCDNFVRSRVCYCTEHCCRDAFNIGIDIIVCLEMFDKFILQSRIFVINCTSIFSLKLMVDGRGNFKKTTIGQ